MDFYYDDWWEVDDEYVYVHNLQEFDWDDEDSEDS